ncbi:probable 18S rRNA (guanine-N(7))-methyltransferase [Macrosteles quadrilineatus]|uniref:probable 18S rRNA (guanine-N(7))-methyltransferase n=1 Tax=Macrosteles quadrilineatus TaxID=74068 RepID=UPI0023E0E46E|nr:probable 18S rRNA (guanine-N(7))-methyltransferase [Macrosteles quadrilineatus]
MASSKRPEHQAPPDIFYNETEAQKYTQNTRIMKIQEEMSERAVELLCLPEDQSCLILDIGCGSGLSGSVLEDQGHMWIGVDISKSMLAVAQDREMEGDFILGDMGHGMPFKAGCFDGAISISALQWLCNADHAQHKPSKRLYKFFSTLYASLSRTARAIFQFYPENSQQIELVTAEAMKAGFFGGLIVDYPNSTKAKKFFLVLMTGGAAPLPKALGTGPSDDTISFTNKRERFEKIKGKSLKKSRNWILEKKERRRRQGKTTRQDSKYSGRKRSSKF